MDITTLQELLKNLAQKIEEKDESAVQEIVDQIVTERERSIIHDLGQMTRELHDALNRVRFDPTLAEMIGKDIPNVKERLTYVIRMTEDAANKSIAAVERSIPLADAIGSQAEALALRTEKLLEEGVVPPELFPTLKQIKSFTEICQIDAKAIHDNLTEVLTAQSFQDLIGQIITRLMNVVQDIEARLAEILYRSTKQSKAEPMAGEGPQVKAETPGYAQNQNDVDSLLSSLGF